MGGRWLKWLAIYRDHAHVQVPVELTGPKPQREFTHDVGESFRQIRFNDDVGESDVGVHSQKKGSGNGSGSGDVQGRVLSDVAMGLSGTLLQDLRLTDGGGDGATAAAGAESVEPSVQRGGRLRGALLQFAAEHCCYDHTYNKIKSKTTGTAVAFSKAKAKATKQAGIKT